jgi:hypothetical protein
MEEEDRKSCSDRNLSLRGKTPGRRKTTSCNFCKCDFSYFPFHFCFLYEEIVLIITIGLKRCEE